MLTTPSPNAWLLVLAQNGTAGAAPATPSQPVNAVGVPGASTTTAPGAGAAPQGANPGPGPGGSMIFWILPAMLLVMILMSVMGGRKEKKKRQELMDALKKGERVQTVGGVLGVVTEIGEQDLVLRVEEGRIRVLKSAVQTVLSKDKGGASTVAEAKPEAKTAV